MGRIFAKNAEFSRKMQFFFDFSCTVKIFALYLHSQSGNMIATFKNYCGNSSVGRAQPCQGWGREFESRFPLNKKSQRNLRLFIFVHFVVKTAPHAPVARFCSTNGAKTKSGLGRENVQKIPKKSGLCARSAYSCKSQCKKSFN